MKNFIISSSSCSTVLILCYDYIPGNSLIVLSIIIGVWFMKELLYLKSEFISYEFMLSSILKGAGDIICFFILIIDSDLSYIAEAISSWSFSHRLSMSLQLTSISRSQVDYLRYGLSIWSLFEPKFIISCISECQILRYRSFYRKE